MSQTLTKFRSCWHQIWVKLELILGHADISYGLIFNEFQIMLILDKGKNKIISGLADFS